MIGLVCGLAAAIVATSIPSFAERGVFFLPFIALLIYYALRKLCNRPLTLHLLFLFFIFLIIFGILGVTTGYIVTSPDSMFYHQKGLEVAAEISQEGIGAFQFYGDPSVRIHTWFLGLFYYLFGESFFAIQSLFAGFIVLTVALINRTFWLLNDQALPYYALLLLVLFPSFYWRGPTLLKEPVATFFISLAIYTGVKWYCGKKGGVVREIVILLFILGGVFSSRYPNLPLVLFFMGLMLIPSFIKSFRHPLLVLNKKELVSLVLILLILFLGFYGSRVVFERYSLSKIHELTEKYEKRGVSQFSSRKISSVKELMIKPIVNLWGLQYLLTPFPWQYRTSLFSFLAIYPTVNSMYTWLITILATVGFVYSYKKDRYFSISLLIFLITAFTAYSIADTHQGGIIRHRMQFVPWLAIYIGFFFQRHNPTN